MEITDRKLKLLLKERAYHEDKVHDFTVKIITYLQENKGKFHFDFSQKVDLFEHENPGFNMEKVWDGFEETGTISDANMHACFKWLEISKAYYYPFSIAFEGTENSYLNDYNRLCEMEKALQKYESENSNIVRLGSIDRDM
jgi:hypothetical protein